jgi:L-malate glycosyltransferase
MLSEITPMRKTVLYIIDSLERGGAETMLVAPLADIHKFYNIILVTLTPKNDFTQDELVCEKKYCLQMHSRKDIFTATKKLKKIIAENNVNIVHSFLYWSSIVARFACGRKTPHVFSLATMMTPGVYELKWYSGYTLLLDRLTYRKNHFLISPTREVLQDFAGSVGIRGKHEILYNFVKEEFFQNETEYKVTGANLRLVAVGNLKDVKNYQVMIDAFKLLDNVPVSLDIYGEGSERQSLQNQITEHGLAIELKGSNERVYEALPLYNAYVMCSYIEGFGVSAAEAMAAGLPLLLSDIKVLREISQDNALFFDPFSPGSFADIVRKILNGKINLLQLSLDGKKIANENFTKAKYLKGLLKLYDDALGNNFLN